MSEQPHNVRPFPVVSGDLLTRRELATRWNIGLTTLDKLVKEGMPSHGPEDWGLRVRRFELAECERWLRNRSRKAA